MCDARSTQIAVIRAKVLAAGAKNKVTKGDRLPMPDQDGGHKSLIKSTVSSPHAIIESVGYHPRNLRTNRDIQACCRGNNPNHASQQSWPTASPKVD